MSKPNNSKFEFGNVFIISITHFIHDVYTSFLAPILPLFIEKFSPTYTLVSFLKVVQSIPSLLNPFIGILADKVKLRYLIIISPMITTILMSLIGLSPSYTVLVIILFFAGISSTLFHVPAPVFIRNISGNEVGKGMSFFMVGGEIARTIGPIVILGAISLWGMDGTYRLIPFGIITSLILYFKFKNIRISEPVKKDSKAIQTFKKYIPFFIILTGIMFFRASMKQALTFYLPTYLNVSGKSLWFSGGALSIIQLAGTAGTFIAGPISDKIGRKSVLVIVTAVTPVLMWLFIVSSTFFAIPLIILMGIFLFASTPVLLAMVNEIKSDRPAFINGIYMTINFTVSSVGVILIGLLTDNFGFELTYRITAIMALGSLPFVLLLKKVR